MPGVGGECDPGGDWGRTLPTHAAAWVSPSREDVQRRSECVPAHSNATWETSPQAKLYSDFLNGKPREIQLPQCARQDWNRNILDNSRRPRTASSLPVGKKFFPKLWA